MKFLDSGTFSSTARKTIDALVQADVGAIAVIVGRGNEVLRTYEKTSRELGGNYGEHPADAWKVHDDKSDKPTLLDSEIIAGAARNYPYRLVLFDNAFEAFAALAAERI